MQLCCVGRFLMVSATQKKPIERQSPRPLAPFVNPRTVAQESSQEADIQNQSTEHVQAKDSSVQSTAELGTWNESGSLLWMLDNNGLLTVKPKIEGGQAALSRDDSAYHPHPRGLLRSEVKAVKFEGHIKGGSNLCNLFSDYPNLETINFGGFDTSSVENFSYMFQCRIVSTPPRQQSGRENHRARASRRARA